MTACLRAATRALLGQAGTVVARRRLRRALHGLDGTDYAARHAAGWRLVRENQRLFEGRAHHANRFHAPWRSLALRRLLEDLGRPPPGAPEAPEILARKEDLEQLVPGAVAVSVHSALASGFIRHLEERGLPSALVISARHPGDTFAAGRTFGIRNPVPVIRNDRNTLIHARKALKGGRIVYALVDRTIRRRFSLCHDIYHSATMFRLAEMTGCPLVFVFGSATEEGRMRVAIEAAPEGAVEARLEAFGDFIARHNPGRPRAIPTASGAEIPDRQPHLGRFWLPCGGGT